VAVLRKRSDPAPIISMIGEEERRVNTLEAISESLHFLPALSILSADELDDTGGQSQSHQDVDDRHQHVRRLGCWHIDTHTHTRTHNWMVNQVCLTLLRLCSICENCAEESQSAVQLL